MPVNISDLAKGSSQKELKTAYGTFYDINLKSTFYLNRYFCICIFDQFADKVVVSFATRKKVRKNISFKK